MMNKTDLAAADFQKALALDPNNVQAKDSSKKPESDSTASPTALISLKQTKWTGNLDKRYSLDNVMLEMFLFNDNICLFQVMFGAEKWKETYRQDGNKFTARFDQYTGSSSVGEKTGEPDWANAKPIYRKSNFEIQGEYYVNSDKSVTMKLTSKITDAGFKDLEFSNKIFTLRK